MSDDASRSATTEDDASSGRRLRPFARPAGQGAASGGEAAPVAAAAVRRAVAARVSAVLERLNRGELALLDPRPPASDAAALATVLAALLSERAAPAQSPTATHAER